MFRFYVIWIVSFLEMWLGDMMWLKGDKLVEGNLVRNGCFDYYVGGKMARGVMFEMFLVNNRISINMGREKGYKVNFKYICGWKVKLKRSRKV